MTLLAIVALEFIFAYHGMLPAPVVPLLLVFVGTMLAGAGLVDMASGFFFRMTYAFSVLVWIFTLPRTISNIDMLSTPETLLILSLLYLAVVPITLLGIPAVSPLMKISTRLRGR